MSDQANWYPQIDRERCTGCKDCITACPTGALGQVNERAALVDANACTYCAVCEDICPEHTIDLPYLVCFSHDCDDTQSTQSERNV